MMKHSLRTPMIVALVAVTAAALLSACADLEQMAQPGSPYTLPSGGAVSSIYSDSYDSSAPASFVKAQSLAVKKMQQQSKAAASRK